MANCRQLLANIHDAVETMRLYQVIADETILLEWLVVRVTRNEKLKGEIVELYGRIKGQNGETALGAKGKVLVTERL